MKNIDVIIDCDPTLKYLIKDAKLDIWNSHQVNLRMVALKLALFQQIDSFIYKPSK